MGATTLHHKVAPSRRWSEGGCLELLASRFNPPLNEADSPIQYDPKYHINQCTIDRGFGTQAAECRQYQESLLAFMTSCDSLPTQVALIQRLLTSLATSKSRPGAPDPSTTGPDGPARITPQPTSLWKKQLVTSSVRHDPQESELGGMTLANTRSVCRKFCSAPTPAKFPDQGS